MREEARGHSRGIVPIAAAGPGAWRCSSGQGPPRPASSTSVTAPSRTPAEAGTFPKQGACPADATAKTRPDCVARRFVAADSAACTALGASGAYSWSTGVCNDLVNTTQTACQAATDRYWNAAASVCADRHGRTTTATRSSAPSTAARG